MRPSPSLLAIPLLALSTLTGCDVALAGYFTPGLFPGFGRPIAGRVVDAATRLPVGGATVLSGLGSTSTDGYGRFSLYGNVGSREISVARAGYVAVTLGGVSLDPNAPLEIPLVPIFPPGGSLPTRFLELSGPVLGLANPAAPALVSLAGTTTAVSNGAYNVSFKGQVPGKVLTGVLAWGTLSAPWAEGVAAPQSFHFLDFGYMVSSWPLGETIPEARQQQAVQIAAQVPIKPVVVRYGNVGAFEGVQTEVLLDFGVLGFVPVARATSSSDTVPVPAIEGLKYVVTGEARDKTGKSSSLVTLTTNDPGKAAFQLLNVPKVESPPNGATGVGQRPEFAWTPIDGDVNYEVVLYEVGEAKPKWIGTTDTASITYPGFAPNDINGAILRPEKKYTWSLRAVELLEETETPSSARAYDLLGLDPRAPIPIKPYRVRKREAEVRENGFTL